MKVTSPSLTQLLVFSKSLFTSGRTSVADPFQVYTPSPLVSGHQHAFPIPRRSGRLSSQCSCWYHHQPIQSDSRLPPRERNLSHRPAIQLPREYLRRRPCKHQPRRNKYHHANPSRQQLCRVVRLNQHPSRLPSIFPIPSNV
jgi:hypothetical protein